MDLKSINRYFLVKVKRKKITECKIVEEEEESWTRELPFGIFAGAFGFPFRLVWILCRFSLAYGDLLGFSEISLEFGDFPRETPEKLKEIREKRIETE